MKYYFVPALLMILNGVESSDNWVEPHAWGRENQKLSNEPGSGLELKGFDPSTCSSLDERVSFTYYKKLILFIFDRSKFNITLFYHFLSVNMCAISKIRYTQLIVKLKGNFPRKNAIEAQLQYDKNTGTLTHAFVVSLSEKELNMLAASLDPRELDSVLSKVLPNTRKLRIPSCTNDSLGLFEEIRMFWINLSLSGEMNFILMGVAFVLLGFYVHKRYGYGLLVTFISGFFLIGFVHTYLDCNRKLQIERMAEALDPKKDPCSEVEPKGMWKIVSYFWAKSQKSECLEHLKNKHKIQLNYCRPDEVLLSYLNEVILNQFKLIVERCTEIIRSCTVGIPFPFNIVAMIIFGVTLLTFLKSIFKYVISPKNWMGYFTNPGKRSSGGETQVDDDKRDRISGENLKTLLSCLQHNIEKPNRRNCDQQILLENSGVEQIESLPHAEERSILNQELLTENKKEKSKESIKCEDLGPES